ncbi:copper resistance CopC family protein [Arthrobacter agilis]|uniref:copper resistance CopC family protein n=1 Tax=Arthrobacter agilis TaxID=37921 RepID=UPI002788AA65|nr:copper resistance CopC family protein [Arthrobacter agilis]MDQ0736929.1 methionine-rich copper-binding protein CopC [Arthrobacter agilis]
MVASLLPPAQHPATPRLGRRPLPAAAGLVSAVLLALAMLLGAGGAASAHDELTGTDPAEGATVEVLPPALELDFSNVPSGIGAQVQVLDESGTDWADGPVAIVDRSATQPLRAGAPAGEYTVNWRVVSSDSHPIEGTFAFRTQQGSTTVPDAASTAGPVDTEEPPANETQTAGVSDFPWSIVLMIAALVVIAAALAVTARRRLGAGK